MHGGYQLATERGHQCTPVAHAVTGRGGACGFESVIEGGKVSKHRDEVLQRGKRENK
jgi:hypothetical protein